MPEHDPMPSDRPLHITGERVVDQFAHLLPQVNLTLIGVLQGLVIGALLTHVQPPASFALRDVGRALLVHNLYLTFIASFLVVVLIWQEYVYAFFTIHWPLLSFWVALQVLLVLPEFGMVVSIDAAGAWSFWAGVAALVGAIIRLCNRWVVSPRLFRMPGESETPRLHETVLQLHSHAWDRATWVWCVVFITAGYLREVRVFPFDAAIHLGSGATLVAFDVVVPLIMIAGTLVNMRRDDRHFASVVERILRAYRMPYRVIAGGVLDERPPDEESVPAHASGAPKA